MKNLLLILVMVCLSNSLLAIDQDDFKFKIPFKSPLLYNTDIDIKQGIYAVNYDMHCHFYNINTNRTISTCPKSWSGSGFFEEKLYILNNKKALIVDINRTFIFDIETKDEDDFLIDFYYPIIEGISEDRTLAFSYYKYDSLVSFKIIDIENRNTIDEFTIWYDSLNNDSKIQNLKLVDAAFTPSGEKFVSLFSYKDESRLVIYEMNKSKKILTLSLSNDESVHSASNIDFLNDSICVFNSYSSVYLWNINSGKEAKRIDFNNGLTSVKPFVLSDDKRYIISGATNNNSLFDLSESKYISFSNFSSIFTKDTRFIPNSSELYIFLNGSLVRYDFKNEKILDYIASTNSGEMKCISKDTLFLANLSRYTKIDINTENIIYESSIVYGQSGILYDYDDNFKQLLLLKMQVDSSSLVLYNRYTNQEKKTLMYFDSVASYKDISAKASKDFEYFAAVNNISKKAYIINKNGNIVKEIYIPDEVEGFDNVINIDLFLNGKKVLFNVNESIRYLDGWTYVSWILIYDVETDTLTKIFSENNGYKYFSIYGNNIIGKFSDSPKNRVIEKNIKSDATVKTFDIYNGHNLYLMKNRRYLLGAHLDATSYVKGYNAVFGRKIFEFSRDIRYPYLHPYISSDGKYFVMFDMYDLSIKIYELSPTSVEENYISESNFLIHPNPASDYIEISFGSHSVNKGLQPLVHGGEIAIYDVLGNRVWKSTENTLTPALSPHNLPVADLREREHRIDISHLPRGVYFVRVGERVEKFVKK